MKASEKAQFAELLTDALAFWRREPSKFALSVWWQACQAFEFEQVAKALTAHAMDPERGQFAPMPADMVKQLQGTQTDRSLIAWGKVLDAIQRVGAYQSVAFDDGVIHAVVEDLGGWVKVCRGNLDELSFMQKRFCDSYRAYARRPDVNYPARLVGEHDQHNALNGYGAAQTALIGDAKRADQVLREGSTAPKTLITMAGALPDVRRIGGRAA